MQRKLASVPYSGTTCLQPMVFYTEPSSPYRIIYLYSLSLSVSLVVQCVTFGWDDVTLDLAFPQFMGTSLAINFTGKDIYVIYWRGAVAVLRCAALCAGVAPLWTEEL
jgi:hypothetical protein